MKSDGAGDESSALRRHQAVGAYQRWNPPSFDAPPLPPPAPEPVNPKDDAAQAEARERRRMQKAAAEMRRRQKEEAEKARAEKEEAQQRAVEAAIAEQKRLLEEQMQQLQQEQRQWPTAEEIEQVHENARKEGFEAGRTEGYAEGHAQGLREGFASGEAEAREQLTAQADALTQAIASLDVALADLDQQVADELIALAVELARKMCLHSIHRPENVRALVQDALQQVPQKHVQLHLHPQDAAHVRARLLEGLDETQQRIVEDDTLTPGGCILLGEGTHLDASVQTRWRRILGEVGFSGHEALWEVGEEEFAAAPTPPPVAAPAPAPMPEPVAEAAPEAVPEETGRADGAETEGEPVPEAEAVVEAEAVAEETPDASQ